MTFTLNDTPIMRAELELERHAIWSGTVTTAGVLDLPDGAAVTLVLGDQVFKGYKVAGGTFEGGQESTFTVAGGKNGWSKLVPAKGHVVPGGVHLADVCAALAFDAGETIDLGGQDRILGDHWTRPAGPASVALSALFPIESGGWRVDPDGIARPGARPQAPVPASVTVNVEDYKAATRWARLSLPNDDVSAVLPGAIVTAGNITTPIVVSTTTIHASLQSVTVEVRGEGGLVELLVALVSALTTPARVFNGIWTYQVVDADTGAPNLRALTPVPGLPQQLSCAKVPGVPGVTSALAPNALVAVAFLDGNPARPFVLGYPGGVLPIQMTASASTEIDLAAPTVNVGGAGALALAQALPLMAWIGLFTAAVQAAVPSFLPPGPPNLTCTKAKGV